MPIATRTPTNTPSVVAIAGNTRLTIEPTVIPRPTANREYTIGAIPWTSNASKRVFSAFSGNRHQLTRTAMTLPHAAAARRAQNILVLNQLLRVTLWVHARL